MADRLMRGEMGVSILFVHIFQHCNFGQRNSCHHHWVADSGVDAAVFAANSTRHAAAGVNLETIRKTADIEEFPKDQVWASSQYLTSKTFESLRSMFTSTKLIQDWFTDCAKLISGVCGESVEWVTPLGLPVVQPYYRRAQAPPSRTALDSQQRPCTMKQRNAFPPNFIHSLDSSHMMLTALHCQAAPLAFVSVHDCYWTHPCAVPAMNQICREQFVALHSQPILEDLSDFLVKRYSYDESELEEQRRRRSEQATRQQFTQESPRQGDFQLDSVLDFRLLL
ncbi:DNA-directed RNA polymerase, mitochondrial-like [Choristoneura fumiferana]|uniref:DNA-directed RNA polymerase, mitochondrial-like n=1 Tax=Choristoneura fumiferana TaxID=7141 RepID=UPI003D15A839